MWGRTVIFILFILMILILLPVLLVGGLFRQNNNKEDLLLKVYDHNRGEIIIMELEDYLHGVLAAEMPALYHLEALKAQAVAARTYTLKQLPHYGGQGSKKYKGADLSTDHTDCQAFLTEAQMKERWGFISYLYNWIRINRAVESTKGQVMLYNGDLIDAVYHANSGGRTEDSVYVWGWELPYLKSTESPYDSENEKSYLNKYFYNSAELRRIFTIEEDRDNLYQIEKISPSGRVLEMRVGNHLFTGIEIREKLDLSSTKFHLSVEDDLYTFTCYGNGHGVGMSQDGANGFAKHGYNYQEILKHYYHGVKITKIR